MPALLDTQERSRLEALHRYRIFDTLPEATFDRVAQLASTCLDAPLAFVSFIERDRQWVKACHGAPLSEQPSDAGFCAYTLASGSVLVVPDASRDVRFCNLACVQGEPRIRFYAGAPLKTPDGLVIGTVFVADTKPREALGELHIGILENLAATVMDTLEARLAVRRAEAGERSFKNILESASDLIYIKDLEGRYTFFNRAPLGAAGPQVADILGKTDWEVFAESAEAFTRNDSEVLSAGRTVQREEILTLGEQTSINYSNKQPFYSPDGELIGLLGVSRDVTEEVRMRRELESSLTLLQATLEATTEGILSVDLDRNILAVNQRYQDMRAVPEELLKNKSDHALLDYVKAQHKDPEAWVARTEHHYQHPELPSRDVIEMVDGRVYDRSSFPMRVGDRIMGRVWSFRDTTEQNRIQGELERSLSLLKTTFDAISKGILNVGLDGSVHSYNQTYVDMWAVPDELLALGDDDALIAHARQAYVDPETHMDKLSELLQDPEATLKDVSELKDGRLIERSLRPQRLNGEVIGRVWTFRDVTHELRTEQALRESEEKFRELAENIDAVFWLSSADLKETHYVSAAYERIWGRSLQAGYEETDDYLCAVHPEDRARVERAMAGAIDGTYDETYRILHTDGTLRWVRDRAFPIFDGEGKPRRIAGIAQDISELKRQQEASERAKEEAEAANRAKSEFLSRMSHELRTPLNAILGFGQLLRMADLSLEDHDAVDDIVKAGKHLLGLIDEVLDIARIESGRMALSLEPVALYPLLGETLEMVAPLADSRKIELSCATGSPGLHIMADQQRLKQVLLNLLSNAIKYNVDFGDVHLSCVEQENVVRVSIRDSGLGIAADMLPRVFEPFDRLGAEASGVEGSGIGLALSRHLVELMDGKIEVESVLGEGSTFWLEFDRAEAPLLVEQVTDVPDTSLDLDALTVVYIEDNLSNIKLIERIFSDMGELKLLTAMQGSLGIELATQHVPDLILLDLHLPDMSGEEVLSVLREHPMTEHTPVLVLSADAMPERIKRVRSNGADAYLTKPLDIAQFTETVRTLLESL